MTTQVTEHSSLGLADAASAGDTIAADHVTGSGPHRRVAPDLWLRAIENAWVLLATYGLMLGLVSLLWLVRGQLFDRDLYESIGGMSWSLMRALDAGVVGLVAALVRLAGGLGVVAAAFVVAVATTAYRKGERWAWYVMCALPLASAVDLAVLASYGALTLRAVLWDVYMLALSLGGLILPLRAFFAPRELGGERVCY